MLLALPVVRQPDQRLIRIAVAAQRRHDSAMA
jgi:hypothetical protein